MADTYKSYAYGLTTTDTTTLYPGLSGTTIVNSINVCNKGTTASQLNIWVQKSGTSYYLCKNENITGNYHFQFLQKSLVLNENDLIQATGASANVFDIITSVMEIT